MVTDTERCDKLKKAIENSIKKGELREFIDSASAKRLPSSDHTKKSCQNDKKSPKNDTSSYKMKVINVIQDVGLPTSRKRTGDAHNDDPLVITMTIDQYLVKRILVDA